MVERKRSNAEIREDIAIYAEGIVADAMRLHRISAHAHVDVLINLIAAMHDCIHDIAAYAGQLTRLESTTDGTADDTQ